MSFDNLNIDPRCLRVLKANRIVTPTPIQAQAIPVALEGCDVIAIAQTGTGKTLAFGLPSLTRLAQENVRGTRMLVLAPTRELAQQVHDVLDPHARALGLRAACVYGGVGMERQAHALRNGTPIIVATPGRLIDHMQRRNVNFKDLSILVLDEADRMLDMGFMPSIERILEEVPKDRQTMMFSATFPKEIAELTKRMQRDAVRIQVGAPAQPAKDVKQGVYAVHGDKKLDLLATILRKEEVTSALVFLRTKHRTDRIAKALHKEGFKAQAIHGGRTQGQRQQAIDGFRRGHYNILVATDVAARGLDIQGISHVVNFDVPNCSDDYVHRIGRTGRANASGVAFTLVCPEEGRTLREIERDLGNVIPREDWDGAVHIGNDGPTREERWGNRKRDVAPGSKQRNGQNRRREAPREARSPELREHPNNRPRTAAHDGAESGHRNPSRHSAPRNHESRERTNSRNGDRANERHTEHAGGRNGARANRRDSGPSDTYTRAERAGSTQFDRVFRKNRGGDFLGAHEAKAERAEGKHERSERPAHRHASDSPNSQSRHNARSNADSRDGATGHGRRDNSRPRAHGASREGSQRRSGRR